MRRTALAIYTFAEFFIVLALFMPVFIVARLLNGGDPVYRRPGRVMRIFGRLTGRLTPLWQFSWDGELPADIGERGYVVVSNHESMADQFLITWLPIDMRWVAKAELFKTPLVGWSLKLAGDIPIKRGDKKSVVELMTACRDTLKNGMPVFLFPEGTRTRDGRMLPFKDGAFTLAIESGAPVLPLAIAGTRQMVIPNSLALGPARGKVRVLEPVSTEGMTLDDLEKLKSMVHDRIQREADVLKTELGVAAELPPIVAIAEAA